MKLETQIKLDRFLPRPYQLPIMDAIENKGYKRVLAILPRRAGKDITAWNLMIRQAVKKVGIYWYILPTYSQARKVIWDSMDNRGNTFLSYIPDELIESTNEQLMRIKFKNGSMIQLIGSENYDSLVGTNARGCVFSEYALQDPRAYQFIRPILTAIDGWAIFLSTPRGKNHLWELWNIAQQNPGWFAYKMTVRETNHIPLEEIERELKSGEVSEDLILQEYFCFPAHQEVMGYQSIKRIRDILPNDLVFTHTGRPRKVIDTISRDYEGEMVSIYSYGSPEPIICTPNHPIRIYNRKNQTYEWKQAKDISISHRLFFPKLSLGKYPVISYELCMLLAWYICEGSSFKNGLQFTVGTQEEVERIEYLLNKIGIESIIIKSETAINVVIYSTQLVDFFKSTCGVMAYDKRIPFSLISSYEDDFFHELMKGDGCLSIHKNHKRYAYTTTSKTLAYQIQMLANSLRDYAAGISIRPATNVTFPHGKTYACHESYSVSIYIPKNKTFASSLQRTKYGIAARIKKVKYFSYSGKVYNLKVQYDESYLVGGRAVHNCSFDMGIEGSYYAKYIDKMRIENRIGDVPWESHLKVHTAWDIGVRDSTAIIFFQIAGQTIRIIDCYEKSKEGLEHYAKVIQSKPYIYGKHIAPHDMRVMEFGSGITRLERARQMGIQFTIADDVLIVDGIEAVRSALSKIWIDNKNCSSLIKALENYRQEFDIKKRVYKSNPLHDWSSHMCDAMRYLCVSLSKLRDDVSPEEIDRRYREAMYGDSSMPAMFRDDYKGYY